MSQTDTEHQHDLVRVEDEGAGLAWDKCRTCSHRSEPEPWAPITDEELAAFNEARARGEV